MRVAFVVGCLTALVAALPVLAQTAAPVAERIGAYTVLSGSFAGPAPGRYCASSGPTGSALQMGFLARATSNGIVWSLLLGNASWNLAAGVAMPVTFTVGGESRSFAMRGISPTQASALVSSREQDSAERAAIQTFINLMTSNTTSITLANQATVRLAGPVDLVDSAMDLCADALRRPANTPPATPTQIGVENIDNWMVAFGPSYACKLASPEDAATGFVLGLTGAGRDSNNVLVPGAYSLELHDRVAQFPGVPLGDAPQWLALTLDTANIPVTLMRTGDRGLLAVVNAGTTLLLMSVPNWQVTAGGRIYRFGAPGDPARTAFQTCMQTVTALEAR